MNLDEMRDGRLHRIPFKVGRDFILACKIMPGEEIPRDEG